MNTLLSSHSKHHHSHHHIKNVYPNLIPRPFPPPRHPHLLPKPTSTLYAPPTVPPYIPPPTYNHNTIDLIHLPPEEHISQHHVAHYDIPGIDGGIDHHVDHYEISNIGAADISGIGTAHHGSIGLHVTPTGISLQVPTSTPNHLSTVSPSTLYSHSPSSTNVPLLSFDDISVHSATEIVPPIYHSTYPPSDHSTTPSSHHSTVPPAHHSSIFPDVYHTTLPPTRHSTYSPEFQYHTAVPTALPHHTTLPPSILSAHSPMPTNVRILSLKDVSVHSATELIPPIYRHYHSAAELPGHYHSTLPPHSISDIKIQRSTSTTSAPAIHNQPHTTFHPPTLPPHSFHSTLGPSHLSLNDISPPGPPSYPPPSTTHAPLPPKTAKYFTPPPTHSTLPPHAPLPPSTVPPKVYEPTYYTTYQPGRSVPGHSVPVHSTLPLSTLPPTHQHHPTSNILSSTTLGGSGYASTYHYTTPHSEVSMSPITYRPEYSTTTPSPSFLYSTTSPKPPLPPGIATRTVICPKYHPNRELSQFKIKTFFLIFVIDRKKTSINLVFYLFENGYAYL